MMPTFSRKHHKKVAKMIGSMKESDDFVQVLTNKFGEFFLNDNPAFNFKSFQSAVTREREGQYEK